MASLNSVTIDLQVKGEATATRSLKDFAKAGGQVGTSVVKLANKVSAASAEWSKLDAMHKKGLITENARRTAQAQLAAQMSELTGLTKAQTLAALKNAEASRKAAAAEAAETAKKERVTQSYNQLRAAIDQSYAARMRLKRAADTLRAAERQGLITRQQAIEQLRLYRDAAQQAAAGGGFMGRNISRAGVLTQQAGYQVGDFIVQVQSGTNAFIAFGQQATQIAGTLTLLGGKYIAIGTALGITIPLLTALGAGLMRANVEADSIYEKFGFLEGSVRGLASAFGSVGGVILNTLLTIVENLDVFVSILGVTAVAATVKFVAASSAMGTVMTSLGLIFTTTGGAAIVFTSATTALTAAVSRLMVVISAHPIIAAMTAALAAAVFILYRARDASSAYQSNVEGLSDALKELRTNAKEAATETARIELGADTGAQAIAMQRILELNDQIEVRRLAADNASGRRGQIIARRRLNALIDEREELERLLEADRERVRLMETASAQSTLDAIISSYDEQYAIQVKINAAQDELNQAVSLGLIGQQEAVGIMDKYRSGMEDVTAETKRAVAEAKKLARALDTAANAGTSRQRQIAVLRAQIEAAESGASTQVAGARAETAFDITIAGGQDIVSLAAGAIAASEAAEVEGLQNRLKGLTDTSKGKSNIDDQARELENVQKIFNDLYDSSEAYRGRLLAISEQFDAGQISVEQYKKEMEALKEATKDGTYVLESAQQALIDYSANATKYGDEIASAMTSAFKGAEDALTDFVMTGKLDFASLANSIVADITRIAIRSAILGPISSSLGGALGGGGFDLGGMFAGVFHNGGIVGSGGNTGRQVSAAAFIGAPRYHNGGIAGLRPNEVPAILERGERVVPKKEVDRGRNVVVNMTINTPDSNSFRRSENQVASMARMAMQRAERNM